MIRKVNTDAPTEKPPAARPAGPTGGVPGRRVSRGRRRRGGGDMYA